MPPGKHPALLRVFQDSDFLEGGWSMALKQAPDHIVLRGLGNKQVVKIDRSVTHCRLVDLAAYDKYVGGEG